MSGQGEGRWFNSFEVREHFIPIDREECVLTIDKELCGQDFSLQALYRKKRGNFTQNRFHTFVSKNKKPTALPDPGLYWNIPFLAF